MLWTPSSAFRATPRSADELFSRQWMPSPPVLHVFLQSLCNTAPEDRVGILQAREQIDASVFRGFRFVAGPDATIDGGRPFGDAEAPRQLFDELCIRLEDLLGDISDVEANHDATPEKNK